MHTGGGPGVGCATTARRDGANDGVTTRRAVAWFDGARSQLFPGGDRMAEFAKVTIEVAGGSGTIVAEPKAFKTGSRGFYGQGKVQGTDGRRFQISVNIVEIGSKSKAAS